MIITFGIPPDQHLAAAELYWEAFGAKLGRVLGPKHRAIAFISSVIGPHHGICAYDNAGQLLGIAGFKTAKGALVGGTFRDMRMVYGWLGAVIRTLLLAALERDVENERFLMDGLCVAAHARGMGVGTALLDAVYAEARKRGYAQVRLDVIDSNPRAKTLYLKRGFREIGTSHTGPLRYVFGFRSATAMVRDI